MGLCRSNAHLSPFQWPQRKASSVYTKKHIKKSICTCCGQGQTHWASGNYKQPCCELLYSVFTPTDLSPHRLHLKQIGQLFQPDLLARKNRAPWFYPLRETAILYTTLTDQYCSIRQHFNTNPNHVSDTVAFSSSPLLLQSSSLLITNTTCMSLVFSWNRELGSEYSSWLTGIKSQMVLY